MIIDRKKLDIQTSGDMESFDFKLTTTNPYVIYDMLRNRVYKNKIGSICREIASNGRDALRRINDFTTPIEIEISDKRHSMYVEDGLNIIFRDYGCGLSKETIEKVYVIYGDSLSNVSNVFTGGYGLGAKTPFSYIDMFMVRTIVDGVDYTWAAYIDENSGKMVKLSEEPTDRVGNMTEIIIPMLDKDQTRFEDEVVRNTYFWPIRPKLINFKRTYGELKVPDMNVYGFQYKVPGKYEIYQRSDFLTSTVNVIVDGIYYPVDIDLIGYNFASSNFAICLFFNNGDLDIAGNRETLEYTDRTINILTPKVQEVIDQASAGYEKVLNDAPTFYEAQAMFDQLVQNDALFNMLKSGKKYYFRTAEGVNILLQKDKVYVPSGYEIIVYTLDSEGKAQREIVKNVFSAKVYNHKDHLYLITEPQNRQKKDRLSPAITKELINRHGGEFILFSQMTQERSYRIDRRNTFSSYLSGQAESARKISELGLTFNDYWAVVPSKALRERKKRESSRVVLKMFENGEYTHDKEFHFQDGYFRSIVAKHIPITDLLYVHMDYEKMDEQTKYILKGMSRVVHTIQPGRKIVISSKLKRKYFNLYDRVEHFLNANINRFNEIMIRSKYDSEFDKLNNYKRVKFEPTIQSQLDEMIHLEKTREIDLTPIRSFIAAHMPAYKEPEKSYAKVFERITTLYPLIHSMSVYDISKYVKYVNENNELRENYLIALKQLDEYRAVLEQQLV